MAVRAKPFNYSREKAFKDVNRFKDKPEPVARKITGGIEREPSNATFHSSRRNYRRQ
jgi:hypothetical protein